MGSAVQVSLGAGERPGRFGHRITSLRSARRHRHRYHRCGRDVGGDRCPAAARVRFGQKEAAAASYYRAKAWILSQ
jgi:hypothetical protein